MKRIVVLGMSGGVDSSVACILMLKEGWNVLGVSLRLLNAENVHERSCCSPEDLFDAGRVADYLDIPHYVVDRREDFRRKIIEKYIEYYRKGLTPNPCTWCNHEIKFSFLKDIADKIGADKVATGHYARVVKIGGKLYIKRARDHLKDQSYFLYRLGREFLTSAYFPLGNMTKEEVRELAQSAGLPVYRKRESQQACFLPPEGQEKFLEKHLGEREGVITDSSGKMLGYHRGYWFYTKGQRKGLNLAVGERIYVKEVIPEENRIVVGSEKEIYSSTLNAVNPVIYDESLKEGDQLRVQIRHRHSPTLCEIKKIEGDVIVAELDPPQRAVTPGQAAVFYRDDIIVAGGEIARGT